MENRFPFNSTFDGIVTELLFHFLFLLCWVFLSIESLFILCSQFHTKRGCWILLYTLILGKIFLRTVSNMPHAMWIPYKVFVNKVISIRFTTIYCDVRSNTIWSMFGSFANFLFPLSDGLLGLLIIMVSKRESSCVACLIDYGIKYVTLLVLFMSPIDLFFSL